MRPINYNKLTKEEWLSYYIPGTIRVLHNKYKFFWSGMYHNIFTNSLEEFLSKKKDKYNHKMALYRLAAYEDKYIFFFVVYCKDKIDVYYLSDKDNYIHSQGQVSYFIKKWKKYYNEENEFIDYEEEYEDTSFNEEEVNALW